MKLTGKIISGKSRGRELGIPTINVDVQTDALEHGVYAVHVLVGNREFDGVMNFGPQPTFSANEVVLEVHLFDFDGDVYGEEAEVEVVERIRGVQTFADQIELVEQIKSDIEEAKRILL